MRLKTKYGSPQLETRQTGAVIQYKGAGPGAPSLEEMRARVNPQAETVIRKFGNARELARVLKAAFPDEPRFHYDYSAIYRWMYPVEVGGTGGEIPTAALKAVLRAARFAGILLTPKDIYPKI